MGRAAGLAGTDSWSPFSQFLHEPPTHLAHRSSGQTHRWTRTFHKARAGGYLGDWGGLWLGWSLFCAERSVCLGFFSFSSKALTHGDDLVLTQSRTGVWTRADPNPRTH